MNRLDKQYIELLQSILDYGVEKNDRTGTGTKSIFGYTIRHKMSEGFPLLTTKKMAWKTMVTELLWFLRGDTNIKFLVDNNCHIWDGDAYKNYLKHTITGVENGLDRIKGHLDNCLVEFEGSYEHFTNPSFVYGFRPHTQEEFINKIKTDDEFAKKWGDLGPIYGKQWRSWSRNATRDEKIVDPGVYTKQIDQIQNLINDLKTNPDSRRLMVSAWNVGELDQMVLPPCHYGFQVYTRELSHDEIINLCLQLKPKSKFASHVETNEILMNDWNIPARAISLMWNQRSVDTFLGLPFNIASYGLLLEIIAKEVNMVPDELIGNLGDVHLYSNHIEQAKEQIGRKYTSEERHEMLKTAMGDFYKTAVDEQVPFGGGMSEYYDVHKIPHHTREPFELPKCNIKLHFKNVPSFTPEYWLIDDFELVDYQSHPTIKAPLSN
jgi:thymidylate synthase